MILMRKYYNVYSFQVRHMAAYFTELVGISSVLYLKLIPQHVRRVPTMHFISFSAGGGGKRVY